MSDKHLWFVARGIIFLGVILHYLAPILTPFLVGALLAYLSDPIVDKLELKGFSRTGGVCVVFLTLSLALGFIILGFIPIIFHQGVLLSEQIPALLDSVFHFAQKWLGKHIAWLRPEALIAKLRTSITEHLTEVSAMMPQVVEKISSSGAAIIGWFANIMLVPVVTFYLLRDWDHLIANIRDLLPRNIEPIITTVAQECDEVLSAFLRGQLLVMLSLGVIYAIGLQIVGLDLGILLGMIAGLASVVPYLGFIVGIIASSVAAIMQYHEWTPLLWVGIVFGIGQLLEGMVLTPKLVGDRIGLHPVAVIFAILAGGQLFGFAGILLALPAAAIIMVVMRHLHSGYKQSAIYEKVSEKALMETPPDTPHP